ncbi:DUF4326 domain-containing protein [Streptomyces tendae]|uniref:DUF4326 domain-containing protein n=1 Tax=Streptomyces tendae TaxID=1932 RepID=UPI00371D34DA
MSSPAAPRRRVRERTEGWRKGDAVIVDRTTRRPALGNPFDLEWVYSLKLAERGDRPAAHEAAVDLFAKWLAGDRTYLDSNDDDLRRDRVLEHLQHLRGKDLACPCRERLRCHAEVLMQWANADPAETARYVALARHRVDRARARQGLPPVSRLLEAA